MRTNELRKTIVSKLAALGMPVYFQNADKEAVYPHITYNFGRANNGDLSRHDYEIIIDVWDMHEEGTAQPVVLDYADRIEDMFDNSNDPQTGILPTFFLEASEPIEDEDKRIKHVQLRITAQNYEQ